MVVLKELKFEKGVFVGGTLFFMMGNIHFGASSVVEVELFKQHPLTAENEVYDCHDPFVLSLQITFFFFFMPFFFLFSTFIVKLSHFFFFFFPWLDQFLWHVDN